MRLATATAALFIALAWAAPASAVSFAFDFRARVLNTDFDIFPIGFTSEGRVEVVSTTGPSGSSHFIEEGTLSIAGLPLTLDGGFLTDVPAFWRLEQFFDCDPCFVPGATGFGVSLTLAPGTGTFLPPPSPGQTFGSIFFFNSLIDVGTANLEIEIVPEPGRSVAWLAALTVLAARARAARG